MTTADSSGRFTLEEVPPGDVFFVAAANGNWGIVDYYAVPTETAGVIAAVDSKPLAATRLALVGDALFVSAKHDGATSLLAKQAPKKLYLLAEAYRPKTAREEIANASSACPTPYVIVKRLQKKTDNFDDVVQKLQANPNSPT